MNTFFDIEKAAKESGLSQEVLNQIKADVRQEFQHDEMMYELHILRAIETEKTKQFTSQEKVRYYQARGEAVLRDSKNHSIR